MESYSQYFYAQVKWHDLLTDIWHGSSWDSEGTLWLPERLMMLTVTLVSALTMVMGKLSYAPDPPLLHPSVSSRPEVLVTCNNTHVRIPLV